MSELASWQVLDEWYGFCISTLLLEAIYIEIPNHSWLYTLLKAFYQKELKVLLHPAISVNPAA